MMERVGDDELTFIYNKISNKNDIKSFSQVSKRFLKVACFRLVSLDISFVDMLYDILPASPNIVFFTCSKPLSNTHLILLSHSCPKLEFLRLGVERNSFRKSGFDTNDFDFDDDGLCAVANACNHLGVVFLNWRLNVGDVGVTSLLKSSFRNLKSLDLEGCVNVTEKSLKAIGEATRLVSLGLHGCRLITDLGLEYLSNGDLKNCLERLILAECDRISDNGIISLKEIVRLNCLVLKKCGVNITDSGVVVLLSAIPNIRVLDLSWLINITDISLLSIASNCFKLWSIHLNGCEAITDRGVSAFAHHPRLQHFTLHSCHDLSWEGVELVILTCICLDYVGLSRRIKTPMPDSGAEDYYCRHKYVYIDWE